MAGNKGQKKTLLCRTNEFFRKCSKAQRRQQDECRNTTDNGLTANPSSKSESYSTWPSINFHTTVQEAIEKMNTVSNKILESKFVEELEQELNLLCPVVHEEQIDFCLMCPQVDHEESLELQGQLCAEYDITGKVFWDCVNLGSDIFSAFEDMMGRSTLLLFYITERFDDSDPCAHAARNILLTPDCQEFQGKVIPLVKDFDTPIPETFQLIDKLYLSSKLQFNFRFPAIFTSEVKQEKVLRSQRLKKKLDAQRKVVLNDLLQMKLRVQT